MLHKLSKPESARAIKLSNCSLIKVSVRANKDSWPPGSFRAIKSSQFNKILLRLGAKKEYLKLLTKRSSGLNLFVLTEEGWKDNQLYYSSCVLWRVDPSFLLNPINKARSLAERSAEHWKDFESRDTDSHICLSIGWSIIRVRVGQTSSLRLLNSVKMPSLAK